MLEWASLRNRPDVREANGLSSSGGASEAKPAKKTGISLALGGIYSSLIVGCIYLVAGLLAALVLAIRRR